MCECWFLRLVCSAGGGGGKGSAEKRGFSGLRTNKAKLYVLPILCVIYGIELFGVHS